MNNRDKSALEVVPTLVIHQGSSNEAKEKKLGSTIDLKVGRRELDEAQAGEVEEGGERVTSSHCTEK